MSPASALLPKDHPSSANVEPIVVGRYVLYDRIASGGMAAVHFGRIIGASGFRRVVAIKRLHPHLALDRKFVAMFLDEARVASRIQHPNVVGVMDVAELEDELFLVMDYVRGDALSTLLRAATERQELIPLPIVSAVLVGALYGLHAAHEARDERGEPMHVVHRDVSPQNVLVDRDGVVRVADFGIAKAVSRLDSTRDGEIKGKLAYMAPEQLKSAPVDRRTDVYAAAVVLWEALVRRPLFGGQDAGSIVLSVMQGNIPLPSSLRPEVSPALDALVLRGLMREREDRFPNALEMAEALVEIVKPATPREVGAWMTRLGGASLEARLKRVSELEQEDLTARGEGAPSSDPSLSDVLARSAERKLLAEAVTFVGAAEHASSPLDAVSAPLPMAAKGLPQPNPSVELSPAERPSSRAWVVALLGTVCVVGIVASALLVRHRASVTPPSAAITASGSPSAVVSAPVAPVAPVAEASASPSTAARETPAGSAASAPTVTIAPSPSVAPKRSPAVAHPLPVAHHAEPAAAKNDCDPPFTVDENGIKRFKRWCPQ